MKPLKISGPGGQELAAAVGWYEAKRQGLGGEFYDAVVQAIELIRTHPEIGTTHSGRLPHRRVRLIRFPYTVVYRVHEDDAYIVAIAHASRRPGYWKNRDADQAG